MSIAWGDYPARPSDRPKRAPRPLRIAHLTTVDMSLALLLGTELRTDREVGHEVFGLSAPGRYVEQVEALGVTHVPVASLTRSWDLRRDLRAFGELVSTLRRLRLDVLHTHTPKAGVMGRIAGRVAGVPVVVNTCHGLWARPEDRLTKRAFVYGLEGLASRFSDFELFQNAQDAATLRRFLKSGRSRVVGNGVDLERFQPNAAGRRRVRAELGVADDELLVGTVGRRVREKGLTEFAYAAQQLRANATFVWVGPEDEVEGADDVPDTDAVRFVGERSDMADVYSALDVFVLASHREGFSRASMEAAACGVPMVLTDIRGCREVGTDGEHLLLTSPHDGDALAKTVGRLLDDPDLRERLGAAARERALSEFDQRAIAGVSLDTYARVADRKHPGGHLAADDRTTVLHVLPADLARGAQAFAGKLRDTLADHPDQRHLAVSLFDSPEAALRADVRLGVRSGLLRRAGLDPRAARSLRRLVRASHAEVVVAHGGEALKYVAVSARRARSVYYKVGLSSAEVARRAHTRLYRALASRSARVVVVSKPILDQCRDVLGVPEDKLSLIPNGRDPRVYYPLADVEHRTDPPMVLWVGQLETGKRPELFLDVVADLRSTGMEFHARIVGDGPLMGDLRDRAAALDVTLAGRRDDVPALLREAAVLVMTSAPDTEGMPGVLIEAGLSGVPVVTTDAAGARDVVVDGETGFVVTSDDAAALATRVGEFLAEPALRSKLGDRARDRCVDHFSIGASARLWADHVTELAAR